MKKIRSTRARVRLSLMAMMAMISLSAFCFFLSPAIAKDIFPEKDLTFICYSEAGGGFDTTFRGMAPFFSKALKEVSPGARGGAMMVKNMTGGSGAKAMAYLYNDAKPDGYTIGDFNRGNLYKFFISDSGEKLDFDVMKFSWLFSVTRSTRTLLVSKKSGIKSLEDLIAVSKKGALRWASSTAGGSEHLETIYLIETFGIPAKVTVWGSTSATVGAILRGDVDVSLMSIEGAKPLIESGVATCLTTFTTERVLKDVATIIEKGWPKIMENIGGKGAKTVVGPPNMDPEARRVILAAAKKTLVDPGFLSFMDKIGGDVEPQFDDELKDFIERTMKFYRSILPALKKYGA